MTTDTESTEDDYRDHYFDDFDGHEPKTIRKMRSFVSALNVWGEEVTTSNIRDVAGLSRQNYHYIYDLLDDKDIIEAGRDSVDGEQQKTASLTVKGEDMWRKKAFDRYLEQEQDTSPTPDPDEQRHEVDELRTRVVALEQENANLRELVGELNFRMDELEDRL